MFLTLLRKECMQYLRSIIYYIFLIYLVFDFVVQMGTFDPVTAPQPDAEGYEEYGSVMSSDKMLVMKSALDQLLYEYDTNEYIAYPIGFYKKVILSEEEQAEVREVILRMTGLTEEELREKFEDYQRESAAFVQELNNEGELTIDGGNLPVMTIPLHAGYTYETFEKDMALIDELIGGGSKYSESSIKAYAKQSPTYEQAKRIYDDFLEKDRVTGAYARLFCDYEGITLALVTVFLAVTRALRDRRAQVDQVIYAHGMSSAKIICSRYLAGVIMAVIPVFVLSCTTLVQSVYFASSIGAACDLLVFVKYIGCWLLPTILVTLALGFLLTEVTDSALAILVQVIWWFVSIYSQESLIGCGRFNLIPRFNAVMGYELYEAMRPTLLWNRIFYTALAMVFLAVTIWIYDLKRKGVFVSVGAKFRNRKGKREA